MKTPTDRLFFDLAPYYPFHQHTARYKRSLPWETASIELDASHIYVASGDRNYSASLFMSGGKLTAVAYRTYESRKDKLAFYGHDDAASLDHLKRTVIHERLTALFREYSRGRCAEVIHAALGSHSPFCSRACAYSVAGAPRWAMETEPQDRYSFGR